MCYGKMIEVVLKGQRRGMNEAMTGKDGDIWGNKGRRMEVAKETGDREAEKVREKWDGERGGGIVAVKSRAGPDRRGS